MLDDDTGESGQGQSTFGMGAVTWFTRYVVYDNATGRIVKYGKARDMIEDGGASMAEQADVGQTALGVSAWPDPKTMYVPGGVLTSRPPCPVAAAVAGRVVTLSGVPVGAAWQVTGDATLAGSAVDATPAFTFAAAGVYKIAVTCFPAIDFLQEFTLA